MKLHQNRQNQERARAQKRRDEARRRSESIRLRLRRGCRCWCYDRSTVHKSAALVSRPTVLSGADGARETLAGSEVSVLPRQAAVARPADARRCAGHVNCAAHVVLAAGRDDVAVAEGTHPGLEREGQTNAEEQKHAHRQPADTHRGHRGHHGLHLLARTCPARCGLACIYERGPK